MKTISTVCHDCQRPYGDASGFPDLLVPDAVWRKISPTGNSGGLLCPSCICKRLHNANLSDVPAAFASGPIRSITYETMKECMRPKPETPQQKRRREAVQKLREVRLATGLSQEQCAAFIGVDEITMAMAEDGKFGLVAVDSLIEQLSRAIAGGKRIDQ